MTTRLHNVAFRALASLAAASLFAIGFAGPASSQETVRFGSVGGLTDAGIYLADELGYFEEAGIEINAVRMSSAPTLLTSIATDQLDVAGISLTPGLFAAIEQGIGLRIVGDKNSSRPGFAAARLAVSTDLQGSNAAETLANLRGKSVGVSSRAGSAFYNVTALLADKGVDVADVNIVELSYSNMVAAMATGAVQAAYMIEPYLSRAIRSGDAIDVANAGELVGDGKAQINVPIVYSEKFAQNRDLAQAFMTAYMRGVRVYNDAFVKDINKDQVIEIMARRAEVTEEVIRSSFLAGLDPNQEINLDAIDAMQAFFVKLDLLEQAVPLDALVDTSFAETAVEKLGRYE